MPLIAVMPHECHGISNCWQPDCLFKSFIRLTSQKHQSPALLDLCNRNPPVTRPFIMWKIFPCHDVIIWCMSVPSKFERYNQNRKFTNHTIGTWDEGLDLKKNAFHHGDRIQQFVEYNAINILQDNIIYAVPQYHVLQDYISISYGMAETNVKYIGALEMRNTTHVLSLLSSCDGLACCWRFRELIHYKTFLIFSAANFLKMSQTILIDIMISMHVTPNQRLPKYLGSKIVQLISQYPACRWPSTLRC